MKNLIVVFSLLVGSAALAASETIPVSADLHMGVKSLEVSDSIMLNEAKGNMMLGG